MLGTGRDKYHINNFQWANNELFQEIATNYTNVFMFLVKIVAFKDREQYMKKVETKSNVNVTGETYIPQRAWTLV